MRNQVHIFTLGKKKKYAKLKIGDIVTISKNKNTFAKGYTPNWPEVFCD